MNSFLSKKSISFLIGILTLFLHPIISILINLILIYFSPKEIRKISAFFLALNLGIIAYFTNPLPSDDLYRHYESMNLIKNLDFFEIFNSSYSLVYFNTIIMYIISLTGLFGLYPMLYVSIGYYLLFYMVLEYSEKNHNSKQDILMMILFVFSIFIFRDFISGLRNQFAFILCSFAIYIDYFKNKTLIRNLIFILSLFIHTSVIIVILAFTIYKLLEDKIKSYKLNLIAYFTVPILIVFFMLLKNLNVTNSFLLKIVNYFTCFGYNNFNVLLFKLLIFSLIGFSLFICRRNSIKLIRFISFFWFLSLGAIFNMTLFYRFNYLIYGLSIIPMLNLLNFYKCRKIFYFLILLILILSIFLMYRSILAYPWNFSIDFFELFPILNSML